MGNRTSLFTTIGMIAAIILAIIFLARGCSRSGKLNDQILSLSDSRVILEREKDSLLRVLQTRNNSITSLELEREALNGELEGLNNRISSISATSASRAARLKEAEEANLQLKENYTAETDRSSSLQDDINNLRERLSVVERDLAAAIRERDYLASNFKEQEEKMVADSIAEANKPEIIPERTYGWYVNTTELGGAYGLGFIGRDYADRFLGLTNVFGYAFSERFTGGIGTGIHLYNGGPMVPLYLDFRYTFGNRQWRPFIVADGGINFLLNTFNQSGAFISPSIGIKRMLNEKSALHLTIGGYCMGAPTSYRSSFLLLRAGYTFNNK